MILRSFQTLVFLLSLASSLTIIDRYGWGAESSKGSIPAMTRITDIVIGDGGGTCAADDSCQLMLRQIQSENQKSGFSDLIYNFYVSAEGTIFEGRGWSLRGDFSDTFGEFSLGIGYLGNYADGMSAGAEDAVRDLIKSGYQNGEIVSDFCLMFTCDLTALQQDVLQGPGCPGGYTRLATWEPLPEVKPKFVYRPCGCGKLDGPSNGEVSYSTYDIGTTASYACTDGYQLVGESTRSCESSGAWSDVSRNPPQCVDPRQGLIIVPKKIWDSVVPLNKKEFIEGGFPVATFFVDYITDGYCVNDKDCRDKLKELKASASAAGESDVLCNFYIAKTGIVYEGRGWGIKGGYMEDIRQTQGICFLGLDSMKEDVATDTLFKLIAEAQKMKIMDANFCFMNKCPDIEEQSFCQKVRSWNMRVDRPDHSNKYCEPQSVPEDNRAPAVVCRHKPTYSSWLNYEGSQATSASGCPCLPWSDQDSTQHHFYPEVYSYADLRENYCRNPDMSESGPWCITDSSCSDGQDSCEIPQCAPSASFGTSSGLQYELSRSRPSLADKLTMTFKPDTLSARLLRVSGGRSADMENYWDLKLVNGVVTLTMQLTLGVDTLEKIHLTFPDTPIEVGKSNSVNVLRKNRRVLVIINGIEQPHYFHKINSTIGEELWFDSPQKYIMGVYISVDDVFSGCMADVTFNLDDIVGVATDAAPRRGTIIMEGISDDGCLSVETFDWSGVDIVTTKPPTTAPKTTQPIKTEPVIVTKNKNLPIIIVIIIVVILLIILLIACFVFKRRNKDKGVYKVDEATTTKWDWKLGILPVLTGDTKKAKSVTYDPIAVNGNGETGEVFA